MILFGRTRLNILEAIAEALGIKEAEEAEALAEAEKEAALAVIAEDKINNENDTLIVSATIDWNSGNKKHMAINESKTFVFLTPTSNSHLQLKLNYSIANAVITFPSSIKWVENTPPSTSNVAGKIDIFNFYYSLDDNKYYGAYSVGF